MSRDRETEKGRERESERGRETDRPRHSQSQRETERETEAGKQAGSGGRAVRWGGGACEPHLWVCEGGGGGLCSAHVAREGFAQSLSLVPQFLVLWQ
jgi:hypothetical protein